ncbi:hypothetical protein HY024_05300 [Candidatus Curtissbacteria bacterium]|nr:hypothetical protein [Candidatus Curtissbacteria bacterium]
MTENPAQPITASSSKFAADKLTGYVLLLLGLLMIAIAVVLAFLLLTGRTKPPQAVNFEAPSIQMPSNGSVELPAQLKSQGFSVSKPTSQVGAQKIISDEVFNFYLNTGLFYLLMMFVASAGSKVAMIGVHLIKDFKIKV